MRLSVKGIQKYTDHRVYYEYPIETLKFEPDDFEGAVVLTVEEAKQVQQEFLDIVCEIVRLVGRYGVKYEKPDSLIILEGRIEQAEKKNA